MWGPRLWRGGRVRICAAMRALPLLLLLAVPAFAAKAPDKAPVHAAGPKAIGHFDDWIAAINPEGGQPTCYAFTRAAGSTPKLSGRGDVVLTVTERSGGRDTVAISAGFTFAPNAAVQVTADTATMEFYTAQRSTFARDGHAAVAAFQKAAKATSRSPGPKGAVVVDTFSLRGFSAAYAAIQKACPSAKS